MKHLIFLITILTLSFSANSQQDTLSVYFENDQFQLNHEIQQNIQEIINDQLSAITINAYTDALASSKYNLLLSSKRAYKVYYYLLNEGIKIKDIEHINSLGETDCKSSGPQPSCRRVDIIYSIGLESKSNLLLEETNSENLTEQIRTAEIGEHLIIKNINFYPGRHFRLPQSEPALQNLLSILKENPSLIIEIQGHICCQSGGIDGLDTDTHDRHLSVNRAHHIYDYLITNGIKKSRLSYQGFGSSKKIYEIEMNEQERVANRRVEIVIIEK